ncbi:MAG: hypothetical protein A2075_02880 [Geobacteraceae bacterium GWC2_58_44]|nr:MAG: hypothetical protein A2075_02880 [Geobacteraceae bacterium GWC2_58_44]HBG07073.1 hypothetical protein [Geobacter sp.]
MRKTLVLIGCLLLLASPLAGAEGVDLQQPGEIRSDKQEIQDRKKEYACDCCQKCKAARRPVIKEEESPGQSNGCKGCCDRCGRVLPLSPEEIPPEIIDKRIPPEVLDNKKR